MNMKKIEMKLAPSTVNSVPEILTSTSVRAMQSIVPE